MRVVSDGVRHARGVRGTFMHKWGQTSSWAALAFAWLMAFVIGIVIYFVPIARLLGSLTE